jgi:choline kinase
MTATVVVLAAGRGRRLGALTDDRPKCLLAVGDSTPLGLLLDQLDTRRVGRVVLIVGHARERIHDFVAARPGRIPVVEVFNPRYDDANNIVSAALARPYADRGFVLVNSDVICDPGILGEALDGGEESFLVVDPALPPRAEAMKVRYQGGRLAAIGKGLDPAASDGEYIGIARFDPPGARAFLAAADRLIAKGGEGEWYEAAIGEACRQHPFGQRSTRGRAWIEIDDPADLERARTEILPVVRPAKAGGSRQSGAKPG